jgi:hypothetical protein
MLYNLENSLPLNYNLQEIQKISNNASDVVMLSYLHFEFGEAIMTMRQFIREFCLTDYPTLDWDYYSYKEYKSHKRYSVFNVTPNIKLNNIDIIKEDIYEEDRVRYLELVSMVAPYSFEKFIPIEKVGRVPNDLVIRKLVKHVTGGIILPKERC